MIAPVHSPAQYTVAVRGESRSLRHQSLAYLLIMLYPAARFFRRKSHTQLDFFSKETSET
jgi:hypothetical protein